MKIFILAIGLLAVSGSIELENCFKTTKEILESGELESSFAELEEEWRSSCSTILPFLEVDMLGENKNLQTTYQTILLLTDFALVYYYQNAPFSYQAFTWAKTLRDWYNWGVMTKTFNQNQQLRCYLYSFKAFTDIWAWADLTFADAAVILLDFQFLREDCPDSPLLQISEFINKYLIPPTSNLLKSEESETSLELVGNTAEGVCLMRASFAYLSWAMTQNTLGKMSTLLQFLNYGTTIYKLQVAKANCWGLIFN